MSDLYEFKMSFVDNDDQEGFLLFMHNFNITLAASGTLEAGAKYQYICSLVRGEALSQFVSLSSDVEITKTLNVENIMKGLAQYPPPINSQSKQNRFMPCGMKKPRALTVRRYLARLIDLNEYLASFPGATLNDKIVVTEINKIFLNSMHNSWSIQAYVKGFYCESIMFKKYANMFKCTEIFKSIYEVVAEPFYKNPARGLLP